jgi:putative glutamine amidotransferase
LEEGRVTLVVGIPACAKLVDGQMRHDTPARYAAALYGGAGALPVMIPPMGEAMVDVLDRLDGLLVPGSPSNVHPDHYGGGASRTPDHHDLDRDATTLRLIPAAIERGMPVLAICRGIQELNVALGGTLHQTVHDEPGRHDHRANRTSLEIAYGPSHLVTLSGSLALIVGSPKIMVNSLHGQAIDGLAPGLEAEAMAPDGTIEAVRGRGPLAGSTGRLPGGTGRAPVVAPWVLGVQWHPEWRYADDSASVAIFRAFGSACAAYHAKSAKWG